MTPRPLHFDAWDPDRARSIAERQAGSRKGALLETLNELQATFGHIHADAIAILADVFNLSRAEVHGVKSFYHDLRDHPPASYVVKICQAEACQAMGCRALTAHAKDRLGLEFHETAVAQGVTLEPVYCLGNCALSPAVMINDRVYGRVDAGRLDALLEDCRKGAMP